MTGFISPSPANGAVGVSNTPVFNVTGSDPTGLGLQYQYKVGTTSNVDASAIWTSTWSTTAAQQVPQGTLQPGVTYYWKPYVRDAYWNMFGEHFIGGTVRSFATNTPAPWPTQGTLAPANGAVVTTLTPVVSAGAVTDANGQTVQYQFRISTGSDGKTGAIVSSGWFIPPIGTLPTWTVPTGSLQDGEATGLLC